MYTSVAVGFYYPGCILQYPFRIAYADETEVPGVEIVSALDGVKVG